MVFVIGVIRQENDGSMRMLRVVRERCGFFIISTSSIKACEKGIPT